MFHVFFNNLVKFFKYVNIVPSTVVCVEVTFLRCSLFHRENIFTCNLNSIQSARLVRDYLFFEISNEIVESF